MKRGRPGAYPSRKRHLGSQDSDWVHQSEEKYLKNRDIVDLIGAERAMPGVFVADPRKTRANDYRVFRPMAAWKAARTAKYPRKRSYAKRTYSRRPKYSGKKGSRFYYSKYNPKSYYVQGSRANVKRFGSTWKKATKTQQLARKRVGYYGRGKYGALGAASGYIGRGMYARAGDYAIESYRNPWEGPYPHTRTYGYKVGGNQLIAGGTANTPVMQSSGYDGSLMVSHRELVQEVYGAGPVPTGTGPHPPSGFEVQTLTVNPGLERVFPWLSQLAANFEEYEIQQCVFEYEGKKMVGTTDELTIHGTVTAAHKFNFKAQEFQDKHEMQSYPHANQCQAHQSLAHGVEADPGKIVGDGHKFIRLGGLLATDDQRDFDHATFSLAQSNIPAELAAKEIGSLYVCYTVKLMKPKLHANRGLAIKSFRAITQSYVTGTTGVDINILGTHYDERADGTTSALAPYAKNTLDMIVKRQALVGMTTPDNTFVFPCNSSGVYKVVIRCETQQVNYGLQSNDPSDGTSDLSAFIFMQGQLSGLNQLGAGGDNNAYAMDDVSLTSGANAGTTDNNSRRTTLEFVIKVSPQIGNVENAFALKEIVDSGAITQTSISITEFNTFGESTPTIGR